ncbi:hypothetical protein B0F90DRAFT_1744392 [Multifurca ochricompacta]|uniref:Uncharacterized protein n=1 Tax=Multifurca ochricompacta TaxID=376703 RepID=A0AAD4LVS8_9AGAM|nr:hypothetical protein B0F90DRAFT_1806884 [Multifurca ochricompacta]KAI0288158.1 hypothetical protein B0F90DRAFT_1804831 [Multifurca ochricompacta]KAI0292345.1 hypothetical protein B0F90DRAFT_1770749 [Multifurca ochricompacta]KAI0292348.1 hypothetical protein B0F90DRAFT_1770759 [Multifurca ochricompacta]KAI0296784.1 hypothetical protein B0F90DRAFT_1744392 [Multifurca ochricompacta]
MAHLAYHPLYPLWDLLSHTLIMLIFLITLICLLCPFPSLFIFTPICLSVYLLICLSLICLSSYLLSSQKPPFATVLKDTVDSQ